MMQSRKILILLGPLLLGACGDTAPAPPPAAPTGAAAAEGALAAHDMITAVWQANPADEVQIQAQATGAVDFSAGPHAIAFPAGAAVQSPPYSLEARFTKTGGRMYEGYGVIFGGEALEAPESEQRYSYFLIRGDGSFLIKQRDGATTRVLHDWSAADAVTRDDAAGRATNRLNVDVGTDSARFTVNGQTVAALPAAQVLAAGVAGIRLSHGVQVRLEQFTVTGESRQPR